MDWIAVTDLLDVEGPSPWLQADIFAIYENELIACARNDANYELTISIPRAAMAQLVNV